MAHHACSPIWVDQLPALDTTNTTTAVSHAYGVSLACARAPPNSADAIDADAVTRALLRLNRHVDKLKYPVIESIGAQPLEQQVQDHISGSSCKQGGAYKVAVVWSGQNDYLTRLLVAVLSTQPAEALIPDGYVSDVVSCIMRAVQKLMASGCFDTVYVWSLGALDVAPGIPQRVRPAARTATLLHSSLLSQAVGKLGGFDVRVDMSPVGSIDRSKWGIICNKNGNSSNISGVSCKGPCSSSNSHATDLYLYNVTSAITQVLTAAKQYGFKDKITECLPKIVQIPAPGVVGIPLPRRPGRPRLPGVPDVLALPVPEGVKCR